MKRILTALLFSVSLLVNAQNFSFGTATAPDGKSIYVDSYGIVIDGKHQIPVMGEIHYSRVPRKDWRREILKMKAGGITVIATYVFWIHHEMEEGKWDWSGNKDLHHFLQLCKEEGMPVVLRIGPFCHGEVYQGGFPEWITNKATDDPKQYKLRSEAPGFIAATGRLYSNIYAQASDMLWKNGGPVIGVQIENECRGPWSYYMRLKDMAVSIGFDTPFYTRTGWPKLNGKEEFGKLLPLYGDYADGFWDRVLTDMPGDYKKAFVFKDSRVSTVIATETFTQAELAEDKGQRSKVKETHPSPPHEGGSNHPDGSSPPRGSGERGCYPYLTCELGGGMMPSYHRRINISGNEAFPLAVCKVGSGSNLPGYYMYHGGTNPYNEYHTMAETQATSVTNYNDMPYMTYDFQAPLGEMGQLNETAFHQTRWFHQFLKDWGEELSMIDVDTLSDNYARRGRFEFHNDYVRILNEEGSSSVTITDYGDGIQPFAKADGMTYFVTIKGKKPYVVDGSKKKPVKLDKVMKLSDGTSIVVLSEMKAKTAFVIDGKMQYAKNGGILYKSKRPTPALPIREGATIRMAALPQPDGSPLPIGRAGRGSWGAGRGAVIEEVWQPIDVPVLFTQKTATKGLREVALGSQKVAAMPTNEDFDKAAVYELTNLDNFNSNLDLYVQISYKGDVARVYADGKLVEDNFWNGKPMLVRLSDLIGKRVELKILPLGKDYPIYLQKEQKALLEASQGFLLSLDSIKMIERKE